LYKRRKNALILVTYFLGIELPISNVQIISRFLYKFCILKLPVMEIW